MPRPYLNVCVRSTEKHVCIHVGVVRGSLSPVFVMWCVNEYPLCMPVASDKSDSSGMLDG